MTLDTRLREIADRGGSPASAARILPERRAGVLLRLERELGMGGIGVAATRTLADIRDSEIQMRVDYLDRKYGDEMFVPKSAAKPSRAELSKMSGSQKLAVANGSDKATL
jgi:hypothetical protein